MNKVSSLLIQRNEGYILQVIIAMAIVGVLSFSVLSTFSGSLENRGNEVKTHFETNWQPRSMTVK